MQKKIKQAKKRRINVRVIIWFFIAILSIISIFTIYNLSSRQVYVDKKTTSIENEQNKKTMDITKTTDQEKNKKVLETGVTHQTPLQYEEDKDEKRITGVITYISKNDNSLVIRITIDQLLKDESFCNLTLFSKDGHKIEKSVKTIDNPSSSTCQGFDIPLSEIKSGDYEINIDIQNKYQTGNIKGNTSI